MCVRIYLCTYPFASLSVRVRMRVRGCRVCIQAAIGLLRDAARFVPGFASLFRTAAMLG